MGDWKERLRAESTDLADKITKLTAFMSSQAYANLSIIDQTLLSEQLTAMQAYQRVLFERIARSLHL